MDTSDAVEKEVRKLDVPLRNLIMRKDTQGEGGEGNEEIRTNNLAEITGICIGEEVGGMLEGNRLALVTVKAHPSNNSDIPEALLPHLIMEPGDEQSLTHPVLEPEGPGEEVERPLMG